MKRALPSLVFCALCVSAWSIATGPPPVPTIKRPHKSAAVHQGAGSAKLIAKIVPVVVATNTTVWAYPPSIKPSNYWWNIEWSADFQSWSVVVSNASGPCDIHVNKLEPIIFYRLAGRLSP
jgi:hypothetical protein